MHDAEAAANNARGAEQGFGLFGRGVGGNVEILGLEPQEDVPDAASHDIGLVTGIVERIQHLEAAGADLLPGDAMFGTRNQHRGRGGRRA